MNILKTLTLGAVALGGLALATPAQARDHHDRGHHYRGDYYRGGHYYGGNYGYRSYRSYGWGGPSVVYADPYYYDTYPYYTPYRRAYYAPAYSFSFGFGGHRHWR